MATVNTLKTRILSKYDLLANYSNFTPLKGEICVAVIGETTTTNGNFVGDLEKKPVVGLKVGDGVTSFNALPWVQAVAGDVSTFIKGIGNEAKFNELVNALIANAKLATADQLAALDARVGTAEGDIDALEAIVVTGDDSNAKLRAAINAVLGASTDTADSNTVYGAKKYAEAQAAAAKSGAEATAEATYEKIGVAKGLVDALAAGQVATNKDGIDAINAKIGSTDIGTDATITSAIKALQDTVGASGSESLGSRVSALEGVVGDAEEGLVKDVADLKAADLAMGGRMDTAEGEIDVLQAATAGYNADNTIANAISGVNDAAAANASAIGELQTSVSTLVGEDTGKSVRVVAAEETAKIVANADTKYDTLKEIADWIMSDTTGAAEMANDIAEMQGLLGVTEGEALPKTVDERIADAIAAENLAQYATDDDLDAAEERIQALEDANKAGGAVTEAIAGAKQEAIDTVVGTSGDAKTANTVHGAKAYADDVATTKASEAQAAAIAAAKTETENQVKALADGAVKANADAIDAIEAAIAGMDATYADTNAGVVTGLTQVDGKVTSVTQRKVKSADLDETDVFVFYCGNATGYDASMGSVDL